MRKRYPPAWLCAMLLVMLLGWRMVGAPLNAEQWMDIKTPLLQAKILLPARLARVYLCWFEYIAPEAQTMDQEVTTEPGVAQPVWLNVYDHEKQCMTKMTLKGYVCGVVAAEMPAAYHLEALKAQAVAARTRVVRQMESGGCSAHPGADICTDSSHCQGYASLQACREKWFDSYDVYRDRILLAEGETKNQILLYQGQPITVLYHAMSGGKTESAQTVFAQAIPYLVSVESSGEESARGFRTDMAMTFDEIAIRLNNAIGTDTLSADIVRQTLSVGSYTETGRVKTVQVGNHEIAATAFRRALDLRSTWFSITMNQDGVTFHQRGYGHGVGMSQVGANSMASDGADYTDILLHYYPGVSLETYLLE